MFKKIVQEPLIQFFISGFVLYGVYMQIGSDTQQNNTTSLKKKIVVTTHANTPLVLEKYKAVLLEEAYFLHLYKQDTQITNILLSKMESIINAQAQTPEPSEKELENFYMHHKKEYTQPKKVSFYIYPLNTQNSQEHKQMQQRLNILATIPPQAVAYNELSLQEVKKRFGAFFAHKISQQFSGFWSGVLLMNNKEVLVYVTKKEGGEQLPFEDVEMRVYQDKKMVQELEKKAELYKKMAQHYEIEVK
jgi:hypothetical protein